MDRLDKLRVASAQAARRIYAALPLNVRFAFFFQKLADLALDAFGRVMYAEFIKRGVVGMPPIHGKPVEEVVNKDDPRLANKLPSGYGSTFASKVRGLIRGKFKDPLMVEEAMQNVSVKFLAGASKGIEEGSPLAKAENYVIVSVVREVLTEMKKQRGHGSLTVDDDGADVQLDVADPDALQQFENIERFWHKDPGVRRKLEQVHPDAPEYIDLSVEGYHDREIVGDPKAGYPGMLPHPFGQRGNPLSPQSWAKDYRPAIFKILTQYVSEHGLAA